MNVSYAIQHHPIRSGLVERLVADLAPATVDVVVDPEPDGTRDPWRTYRLALETTPADATHRLILQDDSIVCPDFAAAAENALEARPDRMICFCVCGQPTSTSRALLRAAVAGERFVRIDPMRWVPVIALAWPARLIRPALDYVDEQGWPSRYTADDEIVGRIVRGLHEEALATVPSLVDHPDDADVESLTRRRNPGNPGRRAALFVDVDPLSLVWT